MKPSNRGGLACSQFKQQPWKATVLLALASAWSSFGFRAGFAVPILLTCLHPGWADVIKLRSGGVIHGRVLEDQSNETHLIIKVSNGQVRVDRSKIEKIVRSEDVLAEYQRRRSETADTPSAQFELAMWCEHQGLVEQAKEHLKRVIELEPNHAGARAKLGYSRYKGQWLTAEELKRRYGLVRYRGRLITEEELAVERKRAKLEEEQRRWHKDIRMWKSWLLGNDPARSREAQRRLLDIRDPQALPAVVRHLDDEPERLRLIMCRILGAIEDQQAAIYLVKYSIADESIEVRQCAAEQLAAKGDPAALQALKRALRSELNVVVRRAAVALAQIGDPEVIPALIDALVTKHKEVVQTRGGIGVMFSGRSEPYVTGFRAVVAPGAVAFVPHVSYLTRGAGIGSLRRKQVIEVEYQNNEVLEALVKLTGENFGFDEDAWRLWYCQQLARGRHGNRPVTQR